MVRHPRLCFLLVFLFIAPAWSAMLAQAQGGSITTFSSGAAQETVTLSSGQHGQIGFELERNTTITSATFFIKPDSSGTTPGWVELDVNGDGLLEWSFNQTGYGSLGQQFQFINGNASAVLPIQPNSLNNSNPTSPSFYLPNGATVSSSSIGVGFSPELTGGFFQTGYIDDVSVGDLNGDANDDFVLFSRTANYSVASSGNASNGTGNTTGNSTSTTANYTSGPAFRLVSFSNATGVAFSSWTPTCNNVTRTMSADLNGDGYDDVINYAPSNRLLCIHFVNSTTGSTFEPQVNVTHSSAIKGLDFADFTGNGKAEMVSIQNNGVVSVDTFSNRTNTFSTQDSLTLYVTGTQTPATLSHMLLDHFNGTSNPPILIAVDSSNDGTEVFWSSGSVVASTSTIAGISSDAVVGDFDGDGDLDIVASRSLGHRSIENRPQGWSGDNHNNVIDLTNATILDYDLDMDPHILIPSLGQVDGNPATLDGNITAYGFQSSWNSQNRVRQQASAVLEPWTSPRAMFLGDLDGDGFVEHLVLAGEGTQHGVFISAWHQVGYDVDNNGQIDFQAEGYAGNGSNGLPMLSVIDIDGNLTGMLNFMTSGLNYTVDAYGIQLSEVNFSMQSLTAGAFTFSNLDITYMSDFLVNINPELSGNLSNVLNQQMTGGTGTFIVPFTFNTSQDGSFIIHTPTVAYVDGAPNIALPPSPILSLVDAQPNRVVFEWQNVSAFGDDVLNFIVYRSPTGQSPNTQTPYGTSVINSSIDVDIKPGEAWSYWVRSVHRFGVTSNLSQPLNVVIPYPIPKSYLPNLTAGDVPSDNGGAMNIQWSQGDTSIVEHRVYIFATNFTNIAGVTTPHTTNATTHSLVVQQDSAGQPLVDGNPYFVAVVGFDEYGNASDNVTTVGPVYTRNDTALPTTLEVSYVGFAEETSIPYVLLARQESLQVDVYLHQDGLPVVNQLLTLHVIGESEEFTSSITTDQSGQATFSFAALSDIGPISAVGPMQLKVVFDGYDQDVMQQPLMGATNTTEAYGTIPVTVVGDDIIELDDGLGFDATFTVGTEDMTHQNALANLGVSWVVTNEEGQTASYGTAEVRGNEMAIAGLGVYDGTLSVYFESEPPQFYHPGMMVSFAMEASPDDPTDPTNQTNTTGGSTFPDITLAATVDCGTASYGWEENATDVTITCSVTNPNPFDALVEFNWEIIPNTPPSIDVVYDGSGPSLTVQANGTVEITFSLVRNGPTEGMFPGEQGKGYVITLTCLDEGTDDCGSMTQDSASTTGEVRWTLGEMPVVDDGNPDTVQDEASSAMTPVVVGIGVVVAILAAIGGVIYMRGRVNETEEDDDEEDYYGMAMEQPASRAETVDSIDLGASKSLDELKQSGKGLHEAAPEGLASSVKLGSSADAFEFGATAEDSLSSEPTDDDEAANEDLEYEDDAGDNGITVDENGTEWWEDEDGVWWYREEGWEDWAVWED